MQMHAPVVSFRLILFDLFIFAHCRSLALVHAAYRSERAASQPAI